MTGKYDVLGSKTRVRNLQTEFPRSGSDRLKVFHGWREQYDFLLEMKRIISVYALLFHCFCKSWSDGLHDKAKKPLEQV